MTDTTAAGQRSAESAPQVRFGRFDGVRIRHADSGGRGPVLVLTSPWPESVFAFAPMWATLAEHARLFAVDLPGFGASERRDDLLSPRTMGGFLARLVAEAGLGRPHLVSPDVGTAAALFAAAEHPELLAGVVVGTGGVAGPVQLGEPLASWVLDPDLDKYRRMDSRAIVTVAVDKIEGGIADDVRADCLACYDGDRFVESMRYVRRYPEDLPVLAELPADDRHPGHDHQRPTRPGRPAGERRFPARAAARQPPRDHRRRPLRLGGEAGRLRLGHPRLDRDRQVMTAVVPTTAPRPGNVPGSIRRKQGL